MELLRHITSQRGSFTRQEAIAFGVEDRVLRHWTSRGLVTRVRHGAYAFTDEYEPLGPEGRAQVLSRAVYHSANATVALSHSSALLEYGVPTWGLDLDEVDVTRLDKRAGRREAGVRQHRGEVLLEDVTRRDGRWVTTGTRTALDITTVASAESGLIAVNGLLHEHHTSLEALERRYRTMRHWPHSLRTELVLRLANPLIESPGESRTHYTCFLLGLPAPQVQYPVFQRGRLLARLDFAWPELKVWIEFDGRVKYREDAAETVFREKRREDEVRRLTGWVCLRITWADLASPKRFERLFWEACQPGAA